MFAALYAPSLPAAALLDVARAFTPRFEQLGTGQGHTVVLLDASGLSRLFGSAQELGEHLRDALQKHVAWRRRIRKSRPSCRACVDANRGDAARTRQSGPHGRDAGQRSDRPCAAQRQRARSIRKGAGCSGAGYSVHTNTPAPSTPAPEHPSTQHPSTRAPQHPSTTGSWQTSPRDSRSEPAEAASA